MTIPRVMPVAGKSVPTSHMRDHTDPCTAVVMGAGGDLMRRKLMPSIYFLAAQHLLPEDFALVGVGREAMQHEEFAKSMRDALVSLKRPAGSQLAGVVAHALAMLDARLDRGRRAHG